MKHLYFIEAKESNNFFQIGPYANSGIIIIIIIIKCAYFFYNKIYVKDMSYKRSWDNLIYMQYRCSIVYETNKNQSKMSSCNK